MSQEFFIDDSTSKWKLHQSRHKSIEEVVRGNQKRENKEEQKSEVVEIEGLSKTLATVMAEVCFNC